MKRRIKKLIYTLLIGIAVCLAIVFFSDRAVVNVSRERTFSNTDSLPHIRVALLLGTAKYLRKGGINPYYAYRIDAAEELYKSGKIEKIVISGDNSQLSYNEPQTMKNDLVKRGIAENNITLDYAGRDTYDSVHRLKRIFSQQSCIIISQRFHNERAIYIAQKAGMTAYGYNARTVDSIYGLRIQIREKLARVKMMLDILSKRDPKFLGDKIEVE